MSGAERRWPIEELEKLLSRSLGEEKAAEVVSESAHATGVRTSEITQEEGLSILERIARQPGLVGITARFAKSHVLLRWQ